MRDLTNQELMSWMSAQFNGIRALIGLTQARRSDAEFWRRQVTETSEALDRMEAEFRKSH